MTGEGLTAAEVEALATACAKAQWNGNEKLAWHDLPAWRDFADTLASQPDFLTILTARTAQAEARGREAALREALARGREIAAEDPALSPGATAVAAALQLAATAARADLAAEVGGDGGGTC